MVRGLLTNFIDHTGGQTIFFVKLITAGQRLLGDEDVAYNGKFFFSFRPKLFLNLGFTDFFRVAYLA